MAIQDLVTGENAALGLASIGSIAWLVRMGMTMFSKQALEQAGATSQKDLLDRLTASEAKWKASYEAERAARDIADRAHDDAQQLIGELKVHNMLLKSLLLQRGMTQNELDVILGLIK